MPINVKDQRAHRVARELARIRGTSITDVVVEALDTALATERDRADERASDLIEALTEIARVYERLPIIDSRSPDEILGYGRVGLPGEGSSDR
ncbi:MAG: protein transcription factor [Spirochaetaceae bacterium]|nr:MAG: protein transcription factor [Spirochaetaceae bacterium]